MNNSLYVQHLIGPVIQRYGQFAGKPVFNLKLYDINETFNEDTNHYNRFVCNAFNAFSQLKELVHKANYDNIRDLHLIINGYEPLLQLNALTELLKLLNVDSPHVWSVEIITNGNVLYTDNNSFCNFIRSTNLNLMLDLYFTIHVNIISDINNLQTIIDHNIVKLYADKLSHFIFNVNYYNNDYAEKFIQDFCNTFDIDSKMVYIVTSSVDMPLHTYERVKQIALNNGYWLN